MSIINESKAYYWLSMSGCTAKRLNAVLSVYSVLEIWERLPADLKLQAAFKDKAGVLLKYRDLKLIDESLGRIKDQNIRVMTLASEAYPEALKQKEVSPPIVLYYRGDPSCLQQPCVAVVGTRIATPYGREVAESFGLELAAAGVTVVSGLATGVDTFAHEAAIESGTTAAVLGGGFKFIPQYSIRLADKIIDKNGIILSEYPPDFCPTKYTFPERNRIISGLSSAVVVVEAAEKSGALITASYALEQGREVYAVPGGVNSLRSAGCNKLIKDGHAAFITSAADVLKDLRIDLPQQKKQTSIALDLFEEKVYNLLQYQEMHFDDILEGTAFPAHQLSALLLSLEMKAIIKRLQGNNYRLA